MFDTADMMDCSAAVLTLISNQFENVRSDKP